MVDMVGPEHWILPFSSESSLCPVSFVLSPVDTVRVEKRESRVLTDNLLPFTLLKQRDRGPWEKESHKATVGSKRGVTYNIVVASKRF